MAWRTVFFLKTMVTPHVYKNPTTSHTTESQNFIQNLVSNILFGDVAVKAKFYIPSRANRYLYRITTKTKECKRMSLCAKCISTCTRIVREKKSPPPPITRPRLSTTPVTLQVHFYRLWRSQCLYKVVGGIWC